MTQETDSKQAAVMPTYGRADIAFVRGKGSWLYTKDDTAYLDLSLIHI